MSCGEYALLFTFLAMCTRDMGRNGYTTMDFKAHSKELSLAVGYSIC